jgi:hypothetical protein
MIVFKIEINDRDLDLVDYECESPILCNKQAPGAFSTAGKLVSLPTRYATQFLFSIHILKKGNYIAKLGDGGRRNAGTIIGLDEAAQSLVLHISDFHDLDCQRARCLSSDTLRAGTFALLKRCLRAPIKSRVIAR